MDAQVLTQRADENDPVATVTLRHPGKLNAITVAMWRALSETFETLSADPAVRVVILRGADGNFAAGADIAEFPTVRAGSAETLRRYHEEIIAPALRSVAGCVHPVVAGIEGACVGGGLELAACCDLRICGENSRFGAPISRLGFSMAPEELRGLLALAGRAVAAELLLEGRILSAAEAHGRGLVHRVVADARVPAETRATADRVAAGAPLANQLNKWLLHRMAADPAPLSAAERDRAFSYGPTRDHAEGVAAFLENRPPRFRGD